MWIQTQNKQRLVNSDQIIDIFISNTGTSIIAHVSMPNDTRMIYLGEYQNRDTCLKVLNELLRNSLTRFQFESMPSDCDVNKWISDNTEVY